MVRDGFRSLTGMGLALMVSVGLLTNFPNNALGQVNHGPASVADLAEDLLGAVVNISTSKKFAASRKGLPQPKLDKDSPFRDFFDELFPNEKNPGKKLPNRPRQRAALGSGFVIDESGIIITNNHVVADADEIVANFADGTKLTAELVGRDAKVDIAVLRVKPKKPLKVVKFGDSTKARVGEWVMAIGNPFGLGTSVSLGIVSAIGRDIDSGPYDNFIQTDAAINRGNSGGPLFNMNGEVIGINTAIISPSGGSIGLGFSIPSELAQKVIKQLLEFGETRRGWLGVQISTVTPEIAESLGMEEAMGALVGDVVPHGPAAAAKLRPGDVILKFDGRDVERMKDLPRIVADTEVGKRVHVIVLRQGKQVDLTVEVGRLEDGEKKMAANTDEKPKAKALGPAVILGMRLTKLDDKVREAFNIAESQKGVAIVEVEPGTHAADKGLEPGMVIVEIAQKAVSTPKDVQKQIEALKKEDRKNALLMVATSTGDIRFVVLRIL